MKNMFPECVVTIFVLITLFGICGCATSNAVHEKMGAQLWSENCNRCHNIPSPVDFTDEKWTKIGMHMKIRANMTDEEIKKIIEFIQSAN
jgi:cytochrome c1